MNRYADSSFLVSCYVTDAKTPQVKAWLLRTGGPLVFTAFMNDALRHLRKEVLPKNPRMFALMAQGPLDEIRRLQVEIEQLTNGLAATPATHPGR